MRFAGKFSPEWGYLAPAPSFIRTVRIVVVAAAVGATAGAGVVFSLMDRPGAEESSVAARTLTQPVDVGATPAATPQVALTQAPQMRAGEHAAAAIRAQSTTPSPRARAETPAASESGTSSTAQPPAGIAALAEAPAATDAAPVQAPAATAADPAPQKKVTRKRHFAWHHFAWRNGWGGPRGPLALLHSANTRAYPPRDDY